MSALTLRVPLVEGLNCTRYCPKALQEALDFFSDSDDLFDLPQRLIFGWTQT